VAKTGHTESQTPLNGLWGPLQGRPTINVADLPGLKVLRYPDPRLRQPARPLRPEELDASVRALLERMHEILAQSKGVGLAATQLGVPLRIFVACPTGEAAARQEYINPRVTSYEGTATTEEGCLSVPGVHTKIKRHAKVTLEAMDQAGKPLRVEAEGLLARIVQHETDHLDGRLLVDRMSAIARLAHRASIKQLEDDYAASPK
jgi:peptide deformylase